MSKLTKLKMLEVIAMFSSLTINELLRIEFDSIEYSILSELENKYLQTDNYKLECIENERTGTEEIQMIFKITDFTNFQEQKEGFLKFTGYYSSWDSAYLDTCVVVQLEQQIINVFTEIKK